jgi:hypothetical protein
MARDDPFTGLSLSEQTNPTKLDQRLFAEPKPAAPQPTIVSPAPTNPGQAPTRPQPAAAAVAKAASLKPASIADPHFDLGELALYKGTFVFTQEELDALDDLKLELHRELDAKITKYDLVRCGLHMLLEDYAANGGRSYVSRKMRKK